MTSATQRQPVLFVGHGSPMNAIEDNAFTRRLGVLGEELARPRAILCVSAHWLSAGTWVTHMKSPRTIHDFGGFPRALHEAQYPAPGSPETAELVRELVRTPSVHLDDQAWGLDHGTWSVLNKLYPRADIPVIQLSIDMSEPPEYHFELGRQLAALRERGVLILGSGNIVHNLRRLDFSDGSKPHAWAVEFDEWVRARLVARDYAALQGDVTRTEAGRLSVPTPDHYLPLLYVLGASDDRDRLRFEYEGVELGAISMRTLRLG